MVLLSLSFSGSGNRSCSSSRVSDRISESVCSPASATTDVVLARLKLSSSFNLSGSLIYGNASWSLKSFHELRKTLSFVMMYFPTNPRFVLLLLFRLRRQRVFSTHKKRSNPSVYQKMVKYKITTFDGMWFSQDRKGLKTENILSVVWYYCCLSNNSHLLCNTLAATFKSGLSFILLSKSGMTSPVDTEDTQTEKDRLIVWI